ncbi:hypothetical protein [Brevibacillus sp. SIMBA_040]|uniref:hypothetical protein n=1 Tax=unclassified Brevibacillus TaxID=2684853 RepID=UPI00397D2CD7
MDKLFKKWAADKADGEELPLDVRKKKADAFLQGVLGKEAESTCAGGKHSKRVYRQPPLQLVYVWIYRGEEKKGTACQLRMRIIKSKKSQSRKTDMFRVSFFV